MINFGTKTVVWKNRQLHYRKNQESKKLPWEYAVVVVGEQPEFSHVQHSFNCLKFVSDVKGCKMAFGN